MYTNAYRAAIARVLAHIDRYRDSELDLDSLAEVARVSKFHFHRVFKEHMMISLGQYVKLKRLETGMWKLIYTQNNILQIAMDSGYESHAAFTRAFKKEMGCSPQEFKDRFMRDQKLAMSKLQEKPPVFLGFKKKAETKIFFIRRRGSYYLAALSAWNDLLADLAAASIRADQQTFYGISQDDPNMEGVEKEDIRFDVGVLASDEIEQKAGQLSAEGGLLKGGNFAVFLHKGALDRLPDSYHFIYGKWIFDNKVTLRDERPFIKYRFPLAEINSQDQEAEIYLPVN
jgi:AraC family transcriptional regulator